MTGQLTSVSFIKKISLILRGKAYLVYTDNPIPSLLIPLPQTSSSIKQSLYKIFTDLTNDQIIKFDNKDFKQKERQDKARLHIDQKDIPHNINFQNIQNVQILNNSMFLTANGQQGILKFMSYQQIKNYSINQTNNHQNDQFMNIEKQQQTKNQQKNKKLQGNIQQPSVHTRKDTGMPYQNPSYSKQPQVSIPSIKKTSFGTVQPESKSQQSYEQQLTKPQQQVRQLKQDNISIQKQNKPEYQKIFDLQSPPRTIPNKKSNYLSNQQFVKPNETQTNLAQNPACSDYTDHNQKYDRQKYFKAYDIKKIKNNQKIIPLALLTDNITHKPINIIHIQTSKQIIKDGTRTENYDEIRKHFRN